MKSDNELMNDLQRDDFDKLGTLFERHKKKLFGFFFKVTFDRDTCEDMIQEVFIRILKYRKSFQGYGKFSTWMFSIAHNVSVDHFRKRNKYVLSEDPEMLETELDHDLEQILIRNEEFDILNKVMLKLIPEKREILILSKIDGLRYKELGKILNCSETAVKVRIFRALKIHDVSVPFIKEIKELGFKDISLSKLISLKIHNVTTEFIKEIKAFGFEDVTLSKITSLMIHNVTIPFIKEIKALGFTDVSLSQLTSLKIHNVDKDFINEAGTYLKKRGKEVTLERIIRMKIQDL